MTRSLYIISCLLLLSCRSSAQISKQELYRSLWLYNGSTTAEHGPEPMTKEGNDIGWNHRTGLKLYLQPRLGIGVIYAYTQEHQRNAMRSDALPHLSDRYLFERGSITAYTNVAGHSFQAEITYVFYRLPRHFAEAGPCYIVAQTNQELVLTTSQRSYGMHTDRYRQSHAYHVIGWCTNAHFRAVGDLYLKAGMLIFHPLNNPQPFNDLITNYYKGSSFVPGAGYKAIPINFDIGIEYQFRKHEKTTY